MTITNFNYEGSYLQGLICNIVVKADLGRSAGRSNPPVPTPSGQDWQLADLLADLSPQIHHGIYIMGYIWQPFLILQEKARISFYFWIIRLVNSQLALYSHVRCNPSKPPKHPSHDNYKFQL